MIAPLVGLALKAGIGPRFAKPLVISLLIVLAIGGLGLGKCAYDNGIRSDEREKIELEDTSQALKGERRAGAADDAARRNQAARAEALKGEVDHAVHQHPTESARPAGPATGAALDGLRQRRRPSG